MDEKSFHLNHNQEKNVQWLPLYGRYVRLLVVDLLAEREAFGRVGVGEIVHHFSPTDVFLWSPHTQDRLDYGFGTVVASPVAADAIVITGSRRNVTMWERWMDDVVELIRETTTPLYGICFGHQIIAHALGGKVERAEEDWHFVAEVVDESGDAIIASFAHQEYVVDAGELEVIASSNHCKIAACKHPTRPIHTVQYHPEAVSKVLDAALACGDMNHEERSAYDDKRLTTDVSIAFKL